MFAPGSFVAEHVTPVREEQIQPNGVDLTLETLERPAGGGRIGREGKSVGGREPIPPAESTPAGSTYELSPGAVVARYGETVHIPDGHVGFLYPRSTLLRNGAMLHTAVWDAGYEGQGAGLLVVHADLELEAGARIGQLVLARANHEERYDGSYQGETGSSS